MLGSNPNRVWIKCNCYDGSRDMLRPQPARIWAAPEYAIPRPLSLIGKIPPMNFNASLVQLAGDTSLRSLTVWVRIP